MTDDDRRRRGLEMMAKVYGWDVQDGPGDFFGYTVDHLFAEIWSRPGLTQRERRLLLIGLTVGQGLHDVADIQVDAALRTGDLDPDQVREIGIFLTHYAGWPSGSKFTMAAEKAIASQAKRAAQAGSADAPA